MTPSRALFELEALPVPAEHTIEHPSRSGEEVEQEIGIQLSDDYKWFGEKYGSGRIDGFVWIYNPFSEREA